MLSLDNSKKSLRVIPQDVSKSSSAMLVICNVQTTGTSGLVQVIPIAMGDPPSISLNQKELHVSNYKMYNCTYLKR